LKFAESDFIPIDAEQQLQSIQRR